MRRRQRSTRLVVASMLLLLAVLAVAGAALSGSWLFATLAAGLVAILGATATRITHTELAESRREAARDRAEQASAYRNLTATRTAEQAEFVGSVNTRITGYEESLSLLARDLHHARGHAVEANRQLLQEQLRADDAERESAALSTRLDDAEGRASQAIIRIAELEQELDLVTAEWQAAQAVAVRKHA